MAEGLESAAKAAADDYEPLFEMNRGIAEFLQGNRDAGTKSLTNALKQLNDPNTEFQPVADYVLVLDSKLDKVDSHGELRVDVAILINLWRMGALSQTDMEAALVKIDSAKAKAWLAQFIPSQST